jgi:hypothetical protein
VTTFEFNDFDWEILFAYSENFKIAEYRFLRLGMAIYLNAKEVALILPVKFTLAAKDSVKSKNNEKPGTDLSNVE